MSIWKTSGMALLLSLIICLPALAQSEPTYEDTLSWLQKYIERYYDDVNGKSSHVFDVTVHFSWDKKSTKIQLSRDATGESGLEDEHGNPVIITKTMTINFDLSDIDKSTARIDPSGKMYSLEYRTKGKTNSVKKSDHMSNGYNSTDWDYYIDFYFPNRDIVERVKNALDHAIDLATGSSKEPF